MRATELAERLSARVDDVVRLLLPKGKRVGQEWRVGGVEGDVGKSLGVHLTGERAGVWSDFATGEAGDLIGLWMATKHLDLRGACKEAMDYLGIRETRLDPPPKRYSRPDARTGIAPLLAEHRAWLIETRRISEAALKAYRIRSRGKGIMFPYLRDGELIASKYRAPPKEFWQDKGCEPCLFGWQAQASDARSVILCEGEMDALAWFTYGFPALSVPLGGGDGDKQAWIGVEYDRLAHFDVIYLNMDDDATGARAERDIIARLGRERCRVVRLPRKDANQCLIDGIPVEEMAHALREARTMDPTELHSAVDYIEDVVAEAHRIDDGIRLPWQKTHNLLLLRPGETSIWAGINGHGKTALVNHVIADAVTHGVRCCVASMEFRAPLWLYRLGRLIAASPHPTDAYLRGTIRALAGWLWLFDADGKAKAARLQEVFHYARRRYGIELFVIDNLTKCGFADDDYAGQKTFVEELSDFARIERCHIAIVAHMRKGENEDHPAGKMAVKGSGGITDMADTVLEVWRNKPREKWIALHPDSEEPMPPSIMRADTYLNVLKQRATGVEPSFALWFCNATTQFLPHPDALAQPLLDEPVHPVGP